MTMRAPEHLRSSSYVRGLTHGLYRYPAAAPPELVRELITSHSNVDDLVLDPFVGGGTTAVEALACGRRAAGFDVNALALFVSCAKTTPLSAKDWWAVGTWLDARPLRQQGDGRLPGDVRSRGLPIRLRRMMGSGLSSLGAVEQPDARRLARCALLRLGQWAVETQFSVSDRGYLPSLKRMEAKLESIVSSARTGMEQLADELRAHGVPKSDLRARRLFAPLSAWEGLPAVAFPEHRGQVKLVVTSPPYPGVHVLYHRWQVMSRRETAAPYWIAGAQDGLGPSYYMMGNRTPNGETHYFDRLVLAYTRIRPLLHRDARVIQLVAFSRPDEQLPRFLSAMGAAGYALVTSRQALAADLVRDVPNRRWYARGKSSHASREVLMIHCLRSAKDAR